MINISKFKEAIRQVSGCITPNPIMPILEGVKIDKGALQANSGEMALTIISDFPDISGIYDFKILQTAINALNSDSTTIAKTDKGLDLKLGKNKISVPLLGSVSEWPGVAVDPSVQLEFTLNREMLEAINEITPFTIKDQLRPALNGINFNGVEFAACDINNLATYKCLGAIPARASNIIPPKVFTVLAGFPNVDAFIFKNNTIKLLENDQTVGTLIYRVIDENYPNYSAVIPDISVWASAKFKHAEMIQALNILSVAVNDKTFAAEFTFDPKTGIVATGYDADRETNAEAFIGAEIEKLKKKITIGLNVRKLLTCLNYMDSDIVSMYFDQPNKAVVFKSENGERTALSMPLQTVTQS